MASAKEQILQFIEDLPEDLSLEAIEQRLLEDIRYRRHIREMIKESREDIAKGRLYSHEEAAKILGLEQ